MVLSGAQLMDFLIRRLNKVLQVRHIFLGAWLCQMVLGTLYQSLAVGNLFIDGQFGYGLHVKMVQLLQGSLFGTISEKIQHH